MKKRFSLRNKLMIVFGLLIFAVGTILAVVAIRTARKAVTEKVETHLIDKATDTAEILDGRINAMFQFLEGIARMPDFADETIPYIEKTKLLNKEIAFTNVLYEAAVADMNGYMYSNDNRVIKIDSYD